jgi:predicted nucleic acid-binding protein
MAIIYLIDSNILVFAANEDSPHQKSALEIMNKVITGKINACLAYQTLYEFYAIIIDPKRVEHPILPQKAQEIIELYMRASNVKKIFPKRPICKIHYPYSRNIPTSPLKWGKSW